MQKTHLAFSSKSISLKVVIVTILLVLGMLAASIAVFESFAFKDAANTAQLRTLSRTIGISSNEIMRQTVKQLGDVATGAQKDRGFRKTVKKLVRDPRNNEFQSKVVEALNEQFHQKFVTTGILDLKKIRIYDTNLKFVVESSEGIKGHKTALPPTMFEKALSRKKAERLKLLDEVWLSTDGAMLSVLAPIGGLRLLAYMEVVVDPAHNLKAVQDMMGLPIRITQVSKEVAYESETWATSEGENTLAVQYSLLGADKKSILELFALEDLSEMYADMANTEFLVAAVFMAVFGVGLLVAMFTLKRMVFKPIEHMVRDMQSIAAGDMRVDASTKSFIREIQSVSFALTDVVENLNGKMLNIREIGGKLSEFSSELDVQAGRALENAKHQLTDIDQLSVATNELVYSMEEVEKNTQATAESTREADDRAKNASQVVIDAENSINGVSNEVNNASDAMDKLQVDVSNVETILSTIQNIAEQTNLLALNAAIEAARAGENGRGFAVVADEVRNLASRTQEATSEVNSVLEGLVNGAKQATEAMGLGQDKVGESVSLAVNAKQSIQEITHNVSQITEMNIEIAKAVDEQSSVCESNSARLTNINSLANQVSTDAENLADRSSSLSQMASKLDQLVDTFKLQ